MKIYNRPKLDWLDAYLNLLQNSFDIDDQPDFYKSLDSNTINLYDRDLIFDIIYKKVHRAMYEMSCPIYQYKKKFHKEKTRIGTWISDYLDLVCVYIKKDNFNILYLVVEFYSLKYGVNNVAPGMEGTIISKTII